MACSRSDTPKTDHEAYVSIQVTIHGATTTGPTVVPVDFARKLERERNHWRAEHDRIRDEYQHRLATLAASALEAMAYPENEKAI